MNFEGIPEALFRAELEPGGAGRPLTALAAASREEKYHPNGGMEGLVFFEMKEPVQLRLTLPFPVEEALFRPSLRNPLPLRFEGNRIELYLPEVRYGVIEVNLRTPGKPGCCIYIFADAPLPEPEKPGRRLPPGFHSRREAECAPGEVVIFAPGVHRFEGNRLFPASGCELFLEPGAVLRAGVSCEDCHNLRIRGHGIFDGTRLPRPPVERWEGRADDSFIHFHRGSDILFDGPLLYNAPGWNLVPEGTEDCVIRNCKTVGWISNTDGIQPRSCKGLLAERCFLKCDDDAIAIKTRSAAGMVSRDLRFRDIICCNEAASCLEIGHSSQGDLLEQVHFDLIECVRGFWGYCHMFPVDHATIRDILYENIYIENNLRRAPEINFAIAGSCYGSDAERGKIRGVTLRNIHVENSFRGLKLLGVDPEHDIRDVDIEDVWIHSPGQPPRRLATLSEAEQDHRSHAGGIRFA